ncbi:MAG TPA: prolyl oligopeptidase family serine peptidase [Candidatus Acidoferrales bacterium]|nr:prolyl oligopeptidase family serine peptidase [Candidatus Acidoferrales bacterium]
MRSFKEANLGLTSELVGRYLEFSLRRQLPRFAISLVLTLGSATIAPAQSSDSPSGCPPKTRVDDVIDTYGSVKVADPYRWLEDQTSRETRAWIDAENKCTEAVLEHVSGRDDLRKRIADLYHTDNYSLPLERSGRYFFTKRLADQDLALIYMRRGRMGADELLVDPLGWSKDHSASTTIEGATRDGKLLYYSRREGGQDEVTIRVFDVDARRDLADVLPSATYFAVEPTPDDRGVYYTKATPDGPRAYYHAIGTDPATDKLMFGDGLSKERILVLELSDDGQYVAYLVLHGSSAPQSEIYIQDVKNHGPVVTVVNDIPSTFFPFFGGHTLYIQTNWNAPNWHVFAADASSPTREHWREVIAQSHDTIDQFAPVGGKLVTVYLHNATSQIVLADADGKNPKQAELPALGSVGVSGEWDSRELFYGFTGFNYPNTNFIYDIPSGHSAIWSKLNAPIDPSIFETEQVWYTSKDGTKVSMFLFHKKGLKLGAANPTILSGYGGFDVSETPAYSPAMIAWVERGGIYALANLRGGGEYGEAWHRAGMGANKQNVFDDFIAAAEFLVANKYTNPGKLAILGGSNGGLLVGAALTQRPDLFHAVVCLYPLLDMLRYQQFMDGAFWVSEYGSSDKPGEFQYIYKYSPYQNVKKGTEYPSVLFVTGDGDTRVAPLHARKMAALLQTDTGSKNPILLLYDTKSGHSGGRPVSKTIDEYTDILSYLTWQLGVPAQ